VDSTLDVPQAEAGVPALAWAPAPVGRWRLMVAAGLLVGPFFPASNVLCEWTVVTAVGGS
jgi:hypothetical protein